MTVPIWKEPRFIVDAVVILVHTLVLGSIWGSDSHFTLETIPGILLTTVELTTICFHVGYCVWYILDREALQLRNPIKWVEYALTATLATIAVVYATDRNDVVPSLVVMLGVAGVTQQAQGYTLEFVDEVPWAVPYTVAWLLQTCEFVAVFLSVDSSSSDIDAPKELVVVTYILTYCMFGVLAAVVKLYEGREKEWPVVIPYKSEIMYSIIGCLSKIDIYVAEYLYLTDRGDWLWVWFGFVLVGCIGFCVLVFKYGQAITKCTYDGPSTVYKS